MLAVRSWIEIRDGLASLAALVRAELQRCLRPSGGAMRPPQMGPPAHVPSTNQRGAVRSVKSHQRCCQR